MYSPLKTLAEPRAGHLNRQLGLLGFTSLRRNIKALLVLETPQTSKAPSAEHRLVLVPAGTWRRQHLLAGEDGIGSSHESHGLFRFGEGVSTGGQTDDGFRHNDAGSGNGSKDSVYGDGLRDESAKNRATLFVILTSFFSRGVPSIGTNVFTGKD